MFEKSLHSPYICDDVFSLVSYELVQVVTHTINVHMQYFHGRFTASGVYYGLTLNATSLAGNDYLDTFISSATPPFIIHSSQTIPPFSCLQVLLRFRPTSQSSSFIATSVANPQQASFSLRLRPASVSPLSFHNVAPFHPVSYIL